MNYPEELGDSANLRGRDDVRIYAQLRRLVRRVYRYFSETSGSFQIPDLSKRAGPNESDSIGVAS